MNATDWLVIAAGLGAAIWVNWYFFIGERGSAHATAVAGVSELRAPEVPAR